MSTMGEAVEHLDRYDRAETRPVREFTRAYTQRSDAMAWLSWGGTLAFYLVTLWLALTNVGTPWLLVPLVVVNAFAGVRLYVLQHDFGHDSMFTTRWMNDLIGQVGSVFTLTPYKIMRFNHNEHHGHLGNLEERHTTEIYTMTVREWQSAGFWKRLYYRLYRNPFVLIPLGAVWTYIFAYRWPKNSWHIDPWGVALHNLALLVWVGLIYAGFGWTGLGVYLATVVTGGCIGVFLVYLQHNFEDTYWDRKPDLLPEKAALKGSSALDLGFFWDLGTGNIAYHDIHHFNARIPSYRLRKCHRALRKEFDVPTIEWPEALRSFTLKLWDEDREVLVPYPKAQHRQAAGIPAE